MKKKILAIVMAISLLVVMQTTVIYGQNTVELKDIKLYFDSWRIENNTLYISGQGVVRPNKDLLSTPFQSVVIEDGITGVGHDIFFGKRNITSLTIAESVKELAPGSFMSCKKLSLVEVKNAIPPNFSYKTFFGVKLKKAKLIVPAGTKAKYETEPYWSKFGTIVESTQPAATQYDYADTLDEPCNIYLNRINQFSGGGAMMRVFLNGVEQEPIGNGMTHLLQTDRVKNELYLQWGNLILGIYRFDALAGAIFLIEYSNIDRYLGIKGVVKIVNGTCFFIEYPYIDRLMEYNEIKNGVKITESTDSKTLTIEELKKIISNGFLVIEDLRKSMNIH